MGNRSVAIRYARALLDVSVAEGSAEEVERLLGEFAALLDNHELLKRVLVNPAVPTPRKRAIVAEIVARGGGVPTPLARLLLLLAERDRLGLLPELVEAFTERLLEHQQVVRAEVTTAAPLPADRAQAMARGLAEVTGKRVSMTPRVDPTIIGGVVARVGSVVYDGSIVRQLERLRDELTEGQ